MLDAGSWMLIPGWVVATLVKEFFCATAFGNDVTVINFPAKTP